jgi:hypothetical protein
MKIIIGVRRRSIRPNINRPVPGNREFSRYVPLKYSRAITVIAYCNNESVTLLLYLGQPTDIVIKKGDVA